MSADFLIELANHRTLIKLNLENVPLNEKAAKALATNRNLKVMQLGSIAKLSEDVINAFQHNQKIDLLYYPSEHDKKDYVRIKLLNEHHDFISAVKAEAFLHALISEKRTENASLYLDLLPKEIITLSLEKIHYLHQFNGRMLLFNYCMQNIKYRLDEALEHLESINYTRMIEANISDDIYNASLLRTIFTKCKEKQNKLSN